MQTQDICILVNHTITLTEVNVSFMQTQSKSRSGVYFWQKKKNVYSAAASNFPFIKQFNVVAGISSV